jgi:O-methyltransferase
MVEGGYIFVHDYNQTQYKGAREATMLFCKENNVKVFPLCDAGGSAVIIKYNH